MAGEGSSDQPGSGFSEHQRNELVDIETNPNYQHPRQHLNIEAAISIYKSGTPNGNNKVLITGPESSQYRRLTASMERGKCHVISKFQARLNGPEQLFPSIHTKSIVSCSLATKGACRKIQIFISLFAFLILLLLGHNPVPPTNSLQHSRLDDECDGVVRHGNKHFVVV